jgi:hypothetical protein
MTKEIAIPFDGFYESISDSIIDDELERELEEHDVTMDDINFNSYKVIQKKYAEEYTSGFQDKINEEFGLNLSLKFKEINSPREYNFTTDKIIVDISDQDVIALHTYIMKDDDMKSLFKEVAKDMYDSRSGFASFYPSFSKEFDSIKIQDWDSNEIQSLLATLHKDYEETNGNMVLELDSSSAFSETKDLIGEKVEKAIAKAKKPKSPNP